MERPVEINVALGHQNDDLSPRSYNSHSHADERHHVVQIDPPNNDANSINAIDAGNGPGSLGSASQVRRTSLDFDSSMPKYLRVGSCRLNQQSTAIGLSATRSNDVPPSPLSHTSDRQLLISTPDTWNSHREVAADSASISTHADEEIPEDFELAIDDDDNASIIPSLSDLGNINSVFNNNGSDQSTSTQPNLEISNTAVRPPTSSNPSEILHLQRDNEPNRINAQRVEVAPVLLPSNAESGDRSLAVSPSYDENIDAISDVSNAPDDELLSSDELEDEDQVPETPVINRRPASNRLSSNIRRRFSEPARVHDSSGSSGQINIIGHPTRDPEVVFQTEPLRNMSWSRQTVLSTPGSSNTTSRFNTTPPQYSDALRAPSTR